MFVHCYLYKYISFVISIVYRSEPKGNMHMLESQTSREALFLDDDVGHLKVNCARRSLMSRPWGPLRLSACGPGRRRRCSPGQALRRCLAQGGGVGDGGGGCWSGGPALPRAACSTAVRAGLITGPAANDQQ